jgi:hypothetical protein
MTHKEYADSLRLVADFFEAHVEVELPHDAGVFSYYSAHTREDMAALARALGYCAKETNDSFFELHSMMGHIQFRAIANRDRICTRKQVGTVHVPATPEQIVPARPPTEQPVYAWDCPDLTRISGRRHYKR